MSRILILILMGCGSAFRLCAQNSHWNQLPVKMDSTLDCPYFVTKDIGFLFPATLVSYGYGRFGTHGPLQRTIDGGQSWQLIPYFDTIDAVDSLRSAINQLYFTSINHGYAAVLDPGGLIAAGGVYETFDTGSHWTRITPNGLSCASLFAAGDTIIVTEVFFVSPLDPFGRRLPIQYRSWGPLLRSIDHGRSWDSITAIDGRLFSSAGPQGTGFYGLRDNREGFVACVYADSISFSTIYQDTFALHLIYSSDNGNNWHEQIMTSNIYDPRGNISIASHSCNVIWDLDDLKNSSNDTYTFLSSFPPFQKWDTILKPREVGSYVFGNRCVQYICNAYDSGLYRTRDEGVHWDSIASPRLNEIDDFDFLNIAVKGYGAILYVSNIPILAEKGGQLWKTTDGGDGTLSAEQLSPRIAIAINDLHSKQDTIFLDQCTPTTTTLLIENLACSYATPDAITLSGLDSAEYDWQFHKHSSCSAFLDTVTINVEAHHPGNRQLTLHAHFTDDEYATIDTTYSIPIVVRPSNGADVTIVGFLKPSMEHRVPGDTITIPLYIKERDGINTTIAAGTTQRYTFALNTDLLEPLNFISETEFSIQNFSSTKNITDISLQIPTALSLNSEVLVGKLQCVARVSDSDHTFIHLSGSQINSPDRRCVAQSFETQGVDFVETPICGSTTLQHFLAIGTPSFGVKTFELSTGSSTAHLTVRNPNHENVSYSIVDAIGIKRLESNSPNENVDLEVAKLPNGVYYLECASQGYQVIQAFSIVR